jgi:Mrp family chromosome partitioning ATPase
VDQPEAIPLIAPISEAPPPGYARLPERPRLDTPPVSSRIIEACSFAMHSLGGPALDRIGVVSALRGEGRTSIAIAMAIAQAHDYGRSALLLDFDFDGPGLAPMFDLEAGPGVADVVRGRSSVDGVLHHVARGVTVMPAGDVGNSSSRLANEVLASNLLKELQGEFDVIVADLPALLHSAAGPLLADAFEQLLMVIRADITPASKVREAAAHLRSEPSVLLNGTESSLPPRLNRLFS